MGAPKTLDGRPIVSPIAFEDGTFLYVCGAGDHATEGRGEGTKFRFNATTAGTYTLEWGFNDWVKAVGGTGRSTGGSAGDEISYGMYAPATELEAVTPGTGSCILVDTGATIGEETLNVIVPYPGGTHNVVSGTEVPVPSSVGEASFWAWDQPNFGRGNVTPAQDGGFNLYDLDIPLARWSARVQLLGTRDISVDTGNVKPMIILPHWVFTAELVVAAPDHAVNVVWEIKCARMRSTKIW
jgi:hypothetical protein